MDGTLCFGYQGEIYTLKPGGKPTKVDIEIMGDLDNGQIENLTLRGASEFAMPDKGDDMAVIGRGEVFAISTKYGTTKQITHTPKRKKG